MKSAISGIVWPALPPPDVTRGHAMLFQLEKSQWLAPEKLQELQTLQLANLLAHAGATVPYYRRRFHDGGFDFRPGRPLAMEEFRRLPLLTRRDLQNGAEQLRSRQIPAGHGGQAKSQTSGSTGTPVVCYGTDITQFFWHVLNERDHLWHRRESGLRYAVIRALPGMDPGEERCLNIEAARPLGLFAKGALNLMSVNTDIATQAAWLRACQPDNLLSYPSNIKELARYFREKNWQLPSLKEIRTIGETLNEEVRSLCHKVWGGKVTDVYSSQELGYLALQCPDHTCYHVQAEMVLLEILNEDGTACVPGETGRVVVTSLHNFAMPLIRYDLGDYAELGENCACGRGLPVLKRILGRQRNIMTTPDGRRYWPSFPASAWHGVAPVCQVRIVQQTLHQLKVEFVAERELTTEEEVLFVDALQARFPCRFEVELARVDVIGRSAGGKYEDFVSLVS